MIHFIFLHIAWIVIAAGLLLTFVFGTMLKERELGNHNASHVK